MDNLRTLSLGESGEVLHGVIEGPDRDHVDVIGYGFCCGEVLGGGQEDLGPLAFSGCDLLFDTADRLHGPIASDTAGSGDLTPVGDVVGGESVVDRKREDQ